MKKIIFLSFFLYLFYFKDSLSVKFINGMEDIPIFKEMKYVEDSLILFDKVEGRYVSSEIYGNYKKSEIIDFYQQILPNLGWKKSKALTFSRGNEILEINLHQSENYVSVIFSIYPVK